ncbi:SDR family oxidoreductase [Massilia sp. H6]|uniref:SDR family oxidoreductase n=1 Tax=Massilia sp. H6 TaxID=2970464 RepID=UPI00216A8937|nr:NAD(P)H-binding protein [Massilia sp. H6]UVW30298.1 NAD(P)H-binding protein [Massilia sp. H6]
MNTIAVIGATGEVGFRLVQALHSSYRIVAIVRNLGKRDFSCYPDVEVRYVADISKVEDLALSLVGCDAIVNTGYIWFAEFIHKAVLESQAQVRHIVFTGSTGIFTRLPSPSADRKLRAEAFIQEHYRFPWTIIRPTMIYGHKDDRNISRLVQAVARYPLMPLIGSGSNLIQPVLIHDLVKAYGTALFNARCYNKSYNIGGSKAYSNRELIACAAASLGRRARLVPLPAALVRCGVALLSVIGLSPISREQVQRFQEDKHIDLKAFITDFNYVPHDFEHGIEYLVHDLKAHGQLR